MNLKLRRLVRTPSSEQYALFDMDRMDENLDPTSAGKLDLHFVNEAVYGSFLLWKEFADQLSASEIKGLVTAVVAEVCEPMGLPAEYAVEFFCPDLGHYELFTNALEDDGDEE